MVNLEKRTSQAASFCFESFVSNDGPGVGEAKASIKISNVFVTSILVSRSRERESKAAKRRIDSVKMLWTMYAIHAYNEFFLLMP